ncbi:hypothetical protein [Phycicoccus sonneratiae]|uniref:Glycosyltransferase RgtA/B/C/D-like domain-containing protein n=1 Tax=Phycicoccus sonneratiae TaxID=2807628 RepID=A0ABS2CM26_9MICO|nr:hypothetical protein [Phycicoccus sonneraticus]MBM6400937.1 hypothetical protein [Phycicoccus sonneraticus]
MDQARPARVPVADRPGPETGGRVEGSRRASGLPLTGRLAPAVLLVVVAAVQTLHAVDDPDTWWHLRTGADLRRSFELVGPDPWSPFTTHEWIRHQWLGDLLMVTVHDVAGLPGIAWLVTAFSVVTVLAVYAVARRRASVLVATAVAVAALVGASMTLSARPQSISLPLTVIAAGAWLSTVRDLRARWWLVPLTWVWACCHGFWFLVPALGVVVAVGLVLERAPWRAVGRAVALAGACLAAAALTPVGPRLLVAPFEVGPITGFIEEWRPPPAGAPAFVAVCVMAGLVVLLRTVGEPPHWAEVGVLVVAGYLAVAHGRTVSLAALLLVPPLASALQERLPFVRERVGRGEVAALAAASAVGLGLTAVLAPAQGGTPDGFPTALSPRLSALPAGTVVCDDYDAGGWLWWAHPDLVPVIDGRTELYTPADLRAYAGFAAGGPGTEAEVRRRGCTAALLRDPSPAADSLQDLGWRLDGRADGWQLLRPGG